MDDKMKNENLILLTSITLPIAIIISLLMGEENLSNTLILGLLIFCSLVLTTPTKILREKF